MTAIVLSGCHVLTMDPERDEYSAGHVVIEGDRITAVGSGPLRNADGHPGTRWVDATGCLATPGLVNTHDHLYQWATRGRAVDSPLFGWLTELYPVWARIGAEQVHAAAAAGLATLALSGCSSAM